MVGAPLAAEPAPPTESPQPQQLQASSHLPVSLLPSGSVLLLGNKVHQGRTTSSAFTGDSWWWRLPLAPLASPLHTSCPPNHTGKEGLLLCQDRPPQSPNVVSR